MKKVYLLSTILVFLLAACKPEPAPLATATAEPSNTALPSATVTLAATPTMEATATATSKPGIALGKRQEVPQAGFSFQNPALCAYTIQGPYVFITGQSPMLTIAIAGQQPNHDNLSEEAVTDQFLSALFTKVNGSYEKNNPHTAAVDGIEGMAFDISGKIADKPIQGEAITVKLANNLLFFSLGFAMTDEDEKAWEDGAANTFHAVIDSITFMAPDSSQSGSSCTISADNTYGYTKENAIKVGGGDFGGPARERAFLDNLLGSDGNPVTYTRTGSVYYGDTILDEYQVRAAGKTVTLYIDEYSWSEPVAPVGFQCRGSFPLSEP